ncbi:MAG: DUF2834 domain-containing protein [Bacteroidetes bacterium]|nr:DUF2834 domain-containing protein [Bacteroidota bacterium]
MKSGITPLMIFFLVCSLTGLVVPWYYNIQHMLLSPIAPSVAEYFRQGTATPLAASLTWDLLIGATAATTFMMIEIRRLNMKFWWLYLVATFLFAFACAFPFFLFMRERRLQKI